MERPLRILMLPWLAHGHLYPFMELAKRLSLKGNFYFHLCSTPANLLSVSHPHQHIDLVELHLPHLPELSPHLHTTKHLPSHLIPVLKSAFDLAEPAFEELLDALHPDLIIHDFLMPWAPAAASRRGIPSVLFVSCGAATISLLFSMFASKEAMTQPLPAFSLEGRSLAAFMRMLQNDWERVRPCWDMSSFVLIKSFRELEGPYIDYLNSSSTVVVKEHIPVGPLVQDDHLIATNEESFELLQWLDKKESSSVLFASFGTEYFMEDEELREIRRALQLCGLDFIWVVRFPQGVDKGSSWADDLPVGFSTRGVVVEGWAPQREILAHRSTGGFLTHCGWSSVMEAMRYGVPMVAMPCHLDQPVNARVVVDMGVGLEVKPGDDGRYKGEEVAKMAREVVVGVEGEAVRRRAREMRSKMEEKRNHELETVAEKLLQLVLGVGNQEKADETAGKHNGGEGNP